MIQAEDNRSLLAMGNRQELHVAFTRDRSSARMFVQDIGIWRQAAIRFLMKGLTVRDLETRNSTRTTRRGSDPR